MARDKLITIRIEGEKRDAFNQLAKSQNSDTASLLYDFINHCLSGTIDISLVMGKGQRIDKLDNQLDTNRLDKLETDTQRLDNWIGALSERLNDWILRSDQRLTDSDQGLSEKIISLEHRLNALAMQLDSQQDSQQIDSIDTDSQQIDSIDTDSQQIDDMEPLLKRERESSIAAPIPTGETSHDEPDRPAIATVTPEVSPSPLGTDAIASIDGTVETVNTSPLPPSLPPDKLGEGGNGDIFPDSPPSPPDRPAIGTLPTVETVEPISTIETVASASETVPKTHTAIAKRLGLKNPSNLSNWIKSGIPKPYQDRIKVVERNGKKKIEWII